MGCVVWENMRYNRPWRKSEKSLQPDVSRQRVGQWAGGSVTEPLAQRMDLDAHQVQASGTRH